MNALSKVKKSLRCGVVTEVALNINITSTTTLHLFFIGIEEVRQQANAVMTELLHVTNHLLMNASSTQPNI